MLSPRRKAQFGLMSASVVLLVAMSIVIGGSLQTPRQYSGQVGSQASPFRLPDIHGKILSTSSLRGSVVVMCFAPTPQSCMPGAEVRRLAQLGKAYAGSGNVKLVAIYSDTESLTYEQIRLIGVSASDAGLDCLTLMDPASRVARQFAVMDMPTFLVIDAAGRIRYRGPIDDPSPDAPLASTSFTSLIELLREESAMARTPSPTVLSNIPK